MSRKFRKRLSIDIPEKIHHELTARAKARNITATRFVLRAILQKLKDERKYD